MNEVVEQVFFIFYFFFIKLSRWKFRRPKYILLFLFCKIQLCLIKLFGRACQVCRAMVNALWLEQNFVGMLVGQTIFARQFLIFVGKNFTQQALRNKLCPMKFWQANSWATKPYFVRLNYLVWKRVFLVSNFETLISYFWALLSTFCFELNKLQKKIWVCIRTFSMKDVKCLEMCILRFCLAQNKF